MTRRDNGYKHHWPLGWGAFQHVCQACQFTYWVARAIGIETNRVCPRCGYTEAVVSLLAGDGVWIVPTVATAYKLIVDDEDDARPF